MLNFIVLSMLTFFEELLQCLQKDTQQRVWGEQARVLCLRIGMSEYTFSGGGSELDVTGRGRHMITFCSLNSRLSAP